LGWPGRPNRASCCRSTDFAGSRTSKLDLGLSESTLHRLIMRSRPDAVAGAEAGVDIVGASDAALLGVLADHVVRLPARDMHEVVGEAADREPAVGKRSAEAVRVDVLNPCLLAPTPDHVADTRVCHARCCDLDAKPEPRGRHLRMTDACPDVLVYGRCSLLADRYPGLVSALSADAESGTASGRHRFCHPRRGRSTAPPCRIPVCRCR
jgi:hypothetical protein